MPCPTPPAPLPLALVLRSGRRTERPRDLGATGMPAGPEMDSGMDRVLPERALIGADTMHKKTDLSGRSFGGSSLPPSAVPSAPGCSE